MTVFQAFFQFFAVFRAADLGPFLLDFLVVDVDVTVTELSSKSFFQAHPSQECGGVYPWIVRLFLLMFFLAYKFLLLSLV